MGPCRHEDQSGLQKVQDLTAETHPVAVCALTREELEDVLDTPHARAVEALKNKGEEMGYDKGKEKWLGDGKSQGMEMGFKKGSESGYDRGYEKGKGKRMDIMGFEKDLLALDQALLQAGVSTYRDDPCRPRLSARGGSSPDVHRRVPPKSKRARSQWPRSPRPSSSEADLEAELEEKPSPKPRPRLSQLDPASYELHEEDNYEWWEETMRMQAEDVDAPFDPGGARRWKVRYETPAKESEV